MKPLTVEFYLGLEGSSLAYVVDDRGFRHNIGGGKFSRSYWNGMKSGESRTVQFAEMGEPAFTSGEIEYLLNSVTEAERAYSNSVCHRDYYREDMKDSVVKKLEDMRQPEPAEIEIAAGQVWKNECGNILRVADSGDRWIAYNTATQYPFMCGTKEWLTARLNEDCTLVED